MKRCIYCGKNIKDDEPVCPHCGENMNTASYSEADVHKVRQKAYTNITSYESKKNEGLTFIVIGGILLVVAIVFLVLSFRYNTKKIKVFTPASVEFTVCCISAFLAVVLETLGFCKLFKSLKNIKFYKEVVASFNRR